MDLNDALTEVKKNDATDTIRCFRLCKDNEYCGMIIPAWQVSRLLFEIENADPNDFFQLQIVELTEEEFNEAMEEQCSMEEQAGLTD